MGREASCAAQVGAETATVKALLEAQALILRGSLRRRWALAALQHLQVAGEALQFQADGEAVRLQLGAAEAGRWLLKIQTPPPSLAAKLGVAPGAPVWLHGAADDAALAQALAGATTTDPAAATQMLVVVIRPADLDAALQVHAGLACPGLWLVHRKGRGVALGDTAIRTVLRDRGYADHKTTAVSDTLTATRWRRG
ncbi:hypothetical protein [Pseudaquabacterium pictum]|uniref:Uncharacterized protein n=1 Tax=Pseudaquabacterium pictum TaxID=2315236 RepID=A0A480AP09_9BURK|nr:hypothetical protein [Rubrivivax pictus]GCL61802.1 hypothetical protein AQPW35_08830 [Rubrivivax pictus]